MLIRHRLEGTDVKRPPPPLANFLNNFKTLKISKRNLPYLIQDQLDVLTQIFSRIRRKMRKQRLVALHRASLGLKMVIFQWFVEYSAFK